MGWVLLITAETLHEIEKESRHSGFSRPVGPTLGPNGDSEQVKMHVILRKLQVRCPAPLVKILFKLAYLPLVTASI